MLLDLKGDIIIIDAQTVCFIALKHKLRNNTADGSIEKYKAIFVTRGFFQKEGIDYEETFAPVARYTSIRTNIALAAKMKWKLHQMDVKTTFLNGVIKEEVYIEQPQGFEVEDKKSHVCKLKIGRAHV